MNLRRMAPEMGWKKTLTIVCGAIQGVRGCANRNQREDDMVKIKYLNRSERAYRLMRRGWTSSLDLIQQCGTVCPTKVRSEVRLNMGVRLESRKFAGVTEYRVQR